MFDEGKFGAWLQLSKVYLIHERPNEKDTSSGASQQVFRRQRVGQRLWIQAFSLVGDANYQRIRGLFEGSSNPLLRVVGVTMEHRVHSGFAHGHGYSVNFLFFQAGLPCPL